MALNHLFHGTSIPNFLCISPLASRAIYSLNDRYRRFQSRLQIVTTHHNKLHQHDLVTTLDDINPPLKTTAYQDHLSGPIANPPVSSKGLPLTRGMATCLDYTRLSLPASSQSRMTAEQLLTLLSSDLQTALHSDAHTQFFSTMHELINDEKTDKHLLQHTVSAKPGHFPHVLHLAHSAGILHWTHVPSETPEHQRLRSFSTVSSFAVVKNQHTDRLITWPRLQNHAGPTPPNPNLPNPASWVKIQDNSSNLLGFHMDVSNMFHHLPLPPLLRYLFPLQAVRFSDLHQNIQADLSQTFGFIPDPHDLVRPFHCTIPMGWTWAVVIAQRVSKRLIAIARTVHRNPFPSGSKHTLDGSFVNLSDGDSLIESYIDDVFGVCAGWEKHDVITLYQTITKIFAEHGLPRHLTKSSPLDSPISSSIPFLGWVWNLLEGIVYPPPEKICHLQESISSIHSSTVSTKVLLTFLGK